MTDPAESDFRWLIDGGARPYLARARESSAGLVTLANSLRKELSAARTHLVLEQCKLRVRAREKFSRADEMFFTRSLLEQATDECIAAYKARRLPPDHRVVDLCCGLGGDLMGWAENRACLGIDRDPIAVLLARANCEVQGFLTTQVKAREAAEIDVREYSAWHIDPDRRPMGKRTTQLMHCEPGLPVIERLLAGQPNGAIKAAPASQLPATWIQRCETEWIGSRRECRQQVAWFGQFNQYPGMRRATVVGRGRAPSSVASSTEIPAPITQRVGRYVLDPHAAVLAARLSGALCAQHDICALHMETGYLTADSLVANALLASFEVLEVLPFDVRRLRAALRQREVGRLEVKVRGAKVDPAELIQTLKLRGDVELTLLVTGPPHNMCAILAQRISGEGVDRP